MNGIDGFKDETGDLSRVTEEAAAVTRAFREELREMRAEMARSTHSLTGLQSGFASGFRRAIDSVVLDGGRLSGALRILADSMSRTAYSAAMKPVTSHLGGLLANGVNQLFGFGGGEQAFAKGGVISSGQVMAFAKGGVVSGATRFPMRGGTGLMGEAGPEAIMPLTRTADGRLGVAAQGGRAVHVTMNISTPDVAGFRRSQSQIAAQMSRAIGQGVRNQ